MAGVSGERGDDVAGVEAARGGLQPGDDTAFAVPGTGGVGEGGEAPRPVRAGLGAAHPEVVGDLVCEAVQGAIARQAEDVVDAARPPMSTSDAAKPSYWKGKGSNERPSSTGARNIAKPPPEIINQVSQSLRYFRPHTVSNHLTTDSPAPPASRWRRG